VRAGELADLLARAEYRLTRELAAVLEEESATVEQWRVLALLADGRGHAMSELARAALLPAPSLTRLVDRMVADNLAYRTADPEDRRRVLVRVTERGKALHARLVRRVEGAQDELLTAASDGEVAELAALLTELAARRS